MNRVGGPVVGSARGVLAVLVTVVALAAPAAAAGPTLVASQPEAGAQVAEVATVRLRFDTAVDPADTRLRVVDAAGGIAPAVTGRPAGPRGVAFDLSEPLAPGRHLLAWQVGTEADGTNASGAIAVTVDPRGTATVPTALAVDTGSSWLQVVAALVAGLGAAAVALVLVVEARRGRGDRRFPAIAVAAGVLAVTAAAVAALAPDAAAADLATSAPWRDLGRAAPGRAWLVVVFLVLALPAVRLAAPAGTGGRGLRVGAAVALVAVAVTGVVATGPPGGGRGEVTAVVDLDDGRMDLVVDPAVVGVNEVHAYLWDLDGRPRPTRVSALAATHVAAGVGPVEYPVLALGPGHVVAGPVDLPIPGAWRLRLQGPDGRPLPGSATVVVT